MFSGYLERFHIPIDFGFGWEYLIVTALSVAALLHLFSQFLSATSRTQPTPVSGKPSSNQFTMGSVFNDATTQKSGKLPLRIAILECDTPLEKTKAKFGGYGGVFKQMLDLSADALQHPGLSSKQGMEISYFHVEQHPEVYPSLDDIDAILLTGSRYDAFAPSPWIVRLVDFVKQALEQDRVRIIGVCFGHQIVGRALNQRVYRGEAGWEVSVTAINLSGLGRKLFKREKLSLYQMHKDIVYGYPSTVEELGYSPVCDNQGMYIKNKLITVQGHPEFTKDIVEEILNSRYSQGVFTDVVYEDAMRRLRDHDDGIAVGQAFLRFLLED